MDSKLLLLINLEISSYGRKQMLQNNEQKYITVRRICVHNDTQGLGECDWGQMAQSDIFIANTTGLSTLGAH